MFIPIWDGLDFLAPPFAARQKVEDKTLNINVLNNTFDLSMHIKKPP
jgi:hypothetical protein